MRIEALQDFPQKLLALIDEFEQVVPVGPQPLREYRIGQPSSRLRNEALVGCYRIEVRFDLGPERLRLTPKFQMVVGESAASRRESDRERR